MRLLKIILISLLLVTIALTTVFYSRSSVVTSIVNNYLIQHDSELTCIDFNINTNFDLVISHLCIDSPYAEIELIDTLLEWRFEANKIDVNQIAEAISAINIDVVTIKAKGPIQFPVSAEPTVATNKVELSELPILIREKLNEITLFSLPVAIDIQAFSYQPFSENKVPLYRGHFSAHAQQLSFSLAEQMHEQIISLVLVKKDSGFNADLSTDLAKLRALFITHETALPTDLSSLILNKSWSAVGKVKSQLNWQKQTLQVTNQITDFYFESSKNFASLETAKLSTEFTWQTNLTGDNLYFDFTGEHGRGSNKADNQGNNIQLTFNSASLIQSLTAQSFDKKIIKLITDNVIDNFTVKPLGSFAVDFAKQTLISDGIDIIGTHLNESIRFSLNDLAINYRDDEIFMVNLQTAKLSFTGKANIAQLQPYSKQPVKLNVMGEVEQNGDFWQLKIAQGSAIQLLQLSLPLAKSVDITTGKSQQEKIKAQPRVKSLLSQWQGLVLIAKNDRQSPQKANDTITFNLDINNQIEQLNYPQVIQVSALEINTKLKGSIDNITINTQVIADDLLIALAKITGNLHQSNLAISAKEMQLTDVLALKVKLPVELNLIDGTIDYRLTGPIKNSENLLANPMTLAVTIKDLTGEVDGTWLQELNWQQKFIIQQGQIKSLSDALNTENNLTIAKIETATPISNLSTKSLINFEDNEINVKVNNTSGNLLGGRFDIATAQWPFSRTKPFEVKLTKIDLEELLELDKKQGIVVTGRVSGKLPIFYDGNNFLIKEGSLHNVGDGLIQVYNNPAVAELKTSSTELKLAFDALENLHYHHLSSDVSMAEDGYMSLITAIKGRNPDLDNEVNLNLNLSYDLLGLLESLNITEHFENKVIKGLQKKN